MKHHLDSRKKAVAVQLPGLHQSGEHRVVEMTLGTSSHRGRNMFTAIIRDLTGQHGEDESSSGQAHGHLASQKLTG